MSRYSIRRRRDAAYHLAYVLFGAVAHLIVVPDCSAAPVGPRAEISCTQKDLGAVPLGIVFAHTFEIRNTGDQPLVVKIDQKSCSCVTSVLSGDFAPPGEALQVEVGVTQATDRKGVRSASITLATNDPQNDHITLSLTGRFVLPVEVSPATINLGDVPVGAVAQSGLKIRLSQYLGMLPEITEVVASDKRLVVERVPISETGANDVMQYRVTLKEPGDTPGGPCYIEVHSNSSVTPVIEVPVRFKVLYPVNIKGGLNVLDLGILEPGQQAVKNAEVCFAQGFSLSTLTATTDNAALHAQIVMTDGARPPVLWVTLNGCSEPGLLQANVAIKDGTRLVGRVEICAIIRRSPIK